MCAKGQNKTASNHFLPNWDYDIVLPGTQPLMRARIPMSTFENEKAKVLILLHKQTQRRVLVSTLATSQELAALPAFTQHWAPTWQVHSCGYTRAGGSTYVYDPKFPKPWQRTFFLCRPVLWACLLLPATALAGEQAQEVPACFVPQSEHQSGRRLCSPARPSGSRLTCCTNSPENKEKGAQVALFCEASVKCNFDIQAQ